MGASKSSDALATAAKYRTPAQANAAIDEAVGAWRRRLGTITVKTPEPSFDLMVNQWAFYQALSCRMWGRTALYQSSGAFGFRDQLQDVMAFVYSEPALTREHILRASSRQFEEGDVQHWWHPHNGRGIRTRFSDDLVWLPFVVHHYLSVTHDSSILDERVHYLKMRTLQPGEDELYELPEISDIEETLFDHCVRALNRACTTGAHGLPLIGSGDWNDGMNRVGIEGRGESVWLAWFLISTLQNFAEHAEARGQSEVASEMRDRADGYSAAIEDAAWDGEWYRRAYYDDGTPLGSKESDECKIDSIAQSWSVISGAGNPERSAQAMQSLNKYLVRDDAKLIMLLTPPFDHGTHDPGYIQGYLPGVRENGAQYTHAALWAVLATAFQGDGDRAMQLYQMINPITHTHTSEDVDVYKVEPYVVAADVYTAEGHLGRGGWTWYTGSASWLYRVGLEAILGFVKRGDTLVVNPCIPKDWKEFTIDYRHGDSSYAIVVRNPNGVERGVASITVDNNAVGDGIPLSNDGKRHEVVVTLGA
jgi:cyclic beta-1,2-glucan synthetase